MLVKVDCLVCRKKHFDHYECSECKYEFGIVNPQMNYCPNCGIELVKHKENLHQWQIEKRFANTVSINDIMDEVFISANGLYLKPKGNFTSDPFNRRAVGKSK